MISERYNAQMGAYLAKLAQTKKPQTNADRIRSMTDEELANMIHFLLVAYNFRSPFEILDWLKEEVRDE